MKMPQHNRWAEPRSELTANTTASRGLSQRILASLQLLLGIVAANWSGAVAANLAAPDFDWVVQIGGTNYDRGEALALDADGNVYVAGGFWGTVRFGTNTITQSAGADLFLARCDAAGTLRWIQQLRVGYSGPPFQLAVDTLGRAALAGTFYGTARFGTNTIVSVGTGANVFLARFATTGEPLWARRLAEADTEFPVRLTLDEAGNGYLASGFAGAFLLGSNRFTSVGEHDVFLTRFDPEGDLVWAKHGVGLRHNRVSSLQVDAAGNAFLAGCFNGALRFDALTLSNNVPSYDADRFLVRFDPAGVALWARQIAGGDADANLAVDRDGSVYVAADFQGTTTVGSHTLTNRGECDMLLAKFDGAGAVSWVRHLGGSNMDKQKDLKLDALGHVYLCGYFRGTASFGTQSLVSRGSSDFFLAQYDTHGNLQWLRQAGGPGWEHDCHLRLDAAGHVYLTGSFLRTAAFGPFELPNRGMIDLFIAKYDSHGTLHWAQSAGGSSNDCPAAYSDEVDNAWAVDATGHVYVLADLAAEALYGTTWLTNAGGADIVLARLGAMDSLRFDVSRGSLHLTNGMFCLQLLGIHGGSPVAIDASTNLMDWEAVCTNAAPVEPVEFCEPVLPGHPARFYRARLVP